MWEWSCHRLGCNYWMILGGSWLRDFWLEAKSIEVIFQSAAILPTSCGSKLLEYVGMEDCGRRLCLCPYDCHVSSEFHQMSREMLDGKAVRKSQCWASQSHLNCGRPEQRSQRRCQLEPSAITWCAINRLKWWLREAALGHSKHLRS